MKRNKIIALFLFGCFLLTGRIFADTYYSSGSEGTESNPKQTNSSGLSNTGKYTSVNNTASATEDDDTYASLSTLQKAQIAMSSNEYMVTAGDIYNLIYGSSTYSIPVDNAYNMRIAHLGVINTKGMTFNQLKRQVERLVNNNYPTGGVQFLLVNPATFKVKVTGEVKQVTETTTWGMIRVSEMVKTYKNSYASSRIVKIISEDGTEKTCDLFMAKRYGKMDQDPYLRPNDTIEIPHLKKQITLSGAVERPGKYELLENENLKSLIHDYGCGYTVFADKDRISVESVVQDKTISSIAYYKDADLENDVVLNNYDVVEIFSLTLTRSIITIEGAVSTGLLVDPAGMSRVEVVFTPGETYDDIIKYRKSIFTASSDLANAYVIRKQANIVTEKNEKVQTPAETHIPMDLNKILYDHDYTSNLIAEAGDILVVPFIQYFISVIGGVNLPGRYAYQPNRDWSYYVNLAGGFDLDQNMFSAVKITTRDGKKLTKKDVIPPEAIITAKRNSPKDGWLLPTITATLSFLTAGLTLYATIMSIVNPPVTE